MGAQQHFAAETLLHTLLWFPLAIYIKIRNTLNLEGESNFCFSVVTTEKRLSLPNARTAKFMSETSEKDGELFTLSGGQLRVS